MLHNPILTIDTVIFHWDGESLNVMLEKREKEPFKDTWALPGGFVHTNEDKCLASARDRILKEKGGIKPPYFEKVDSIGSPDRDPRGWAVSVIYLGILKAEDRRPRRADKNIMFANVHDVMEGQYDLAFDHVKIVELAFLRLAVRCGYSAIPLWFMPKEFTIRQLLDIHEVLMGSPPNKPSVLKRYVESGTIEAIIDPETNQPKKVSRPAGPRATIYRHNLKEPVNFAGVMGTT